MRIGIDLGGTKIEAALLDTSGHIVARRRRPTPQGDYEATLDAVAELVAGLGADPSTPVGVATPGALSPATGLIKNSNSVWLNGRSLNRDLAQTLDRPVRLANDADCFALSEASDGAAAGYDVVFGVIVGTGTGGGLVVGGRLLQGPNAITGEWGHNPLPWMTEAERPGADCYCGRRGCIETFLSGPGLARAYSARTGLQRNAIDIAARAHAGEEDARAVLATYDDRMARALAGVINIVDPHVIVLGGGMSNMPHLYHSVPALWTAYVFSDRVDTQLVRARYGDSSGVRGAAWLWPE